VLQCCRDALEALLLRVELAASPGETFSGNGSLSEQCSISLCDVLKLKRLTQFRKETVQRNSFYMAQ